MNSSQQRQFVEELLNQMPELNSEKYQIYRKELDEKLARARNDEKSMRRIVIGAWSSTSVIYAIVVILCYRLGAPPINSPTGLCCCWPRASCSCPWPRCYC
jgi:hypothetical protein